jgi:hypothetical protein
MMGLIVGRLREYASKSRFGGFDFGSWWNFYWFLKSCMKFLL